MLFFKFNNIIKKQIEFIEESYKLKMQRGPQLDIESDPLHEQDVSILYNVLKFLQNCVEGHYLDLQKYFRLQTNSRNNYDMISSVADLLRSYYYCARNVEMYDNIMQCLETLSEFVQGPCLENQTGVAESKFFEITGDIFSQSQTYVPAENEQPLESWQIARIQNKCLILILSLLEMRDVKTD